MKSLATVTKASILGIKLLYYIVLNFSNKDLALRLPSSGTFFSGGLEWV